MTAAQRREIPAWLITESEAVDTDLAALQTGKEADAFLLERRLGERAHLLVAKRYRDRTHRSFRNDAAYRSARRTGKRREDLAMAKGTDAGLRIRDQQWALHEFRTLRRLWDAGVAVPYPISCNGTEILMEYVGELDQPAPRLIDISRAGDVDYADLWAQCLAAIRAMTACDVVHADLSAYNILVWKGRIYVIDFPQSADIGLTERDMEFLRRDIDNLVTFFSRRGVVCDLEEVFADAISRVAWI
jgi:RIO kinase 1